MSKRELTIKECRTAPGFFVTEIARIDAVDGLAGLDDGSVNLIVTDPPYESLEKHRKVGTTTRLKHSTKSSNDWFEVFPDSRLPELFYHMYRVLAADSHLYFMCNDETSNVVFAMLTRTGLLRRGRFTWWKRIVWDKQVMGMGYHYRARYEFVLFLEKGKRKLNDLGVPDVLSFKRIYRGYPTEKPVGLMKALIANSTVEDDVVCDPFMGSGSVGVAAVELGRQFIGFDTAPSAMELSEKRIHEAAKA